ncbi:MAG: Response regulator receiver protein [Chthoniobacteraceae bacterium]|nr:Response regulator receiver protein [Chthoniobacteraceae bacterium]
MHARVVHVDRGDASGRIYFAGGQAVHAQVGSITGEDAFFEILSWQKGVFHMEEGVRAIEETITRPWESLLMEAAHINDEQGLNTTVTAFPLTEPVVMPHKFITDAFADPEILNAIYMADDGTLLETKGDDPETIQGTFAYIMQLLQHVGTALGAEQVREVHFIGSSNRALCLSGEAKTTAAVTTSKVNLPNLAKKLANP